MRDLAQEDGFTLIELLVVILMLSMVITGFFSVLFSGSRGAETAERTVHSAQEARAGFNRMIRDVREATIIDNAGSDAFRVQTDFDGNGAYENPNVSGDYEILTIAYDEDDRSIRLNGAVLIEDVERASGTEVFSYSSNLLSYDWNGDGVTTSEELDAAPAHGVTGVGNGDGVLNYPELSSISNVSFSFTIDNGTGETHFFGEAQLRNRR
jgi:prepilin-type N-terminal cleavage/methylation domain-containing protein